MCKSGVVERQIALPAEDLGLGAGEGAASASAVIISSVNQNRNLCAIAVDLSSFRATPTNLRPVFNDSKMTESTGLAYSTVLQNSAATEPV